MDTLVELFYRFTTHYICKTILNTILFATSKQQFMQQKDANIPPEMNITVDMDILRAYAAKK